MEEKVEDDRQEKGKAKASKKKKSIEKPRSESPPVEEFILPCEWGDCQEQFTDMDQFVEHMTHHLSQYCQNIERPPKLEHGGALFECQWRECKSQVIGHPNDFFRHAYFHVFHVKIKCVGQTLVRKMESDKCMLDAQSRNLIPELPERLQCGWTLCHGIYDNPEYFYRHVNLHAENFPDGNNVAGGCPCSWEGCDTVVKSKHKLKEHLRSHTQEKIVACPTCGGLFASRTKFLDHMKRQQTSAAQCYQCSHCNKRFVTERLLRDHMRHHVNQYKCRYCDMTCPAPSSLKNHMRYRHSEEKPFACEHCDYCCKSGSDLRKHMESHNIDAPFRCHAANCKYTARSYQSLANHFKRLHQTLDVAKYACHVCDGLFTRGAGLTMHLKKKHRFRWPAGHSRFRYKMHEDGFWRLQTIRYESIELTKQVMDDENSKGPVTMEIENSEQENSNNVVNAEFKNNVIEQVAMETGYVGATPEDSKSSCSVASQFTLERQEGISEQGEEEDVNIAYNLEMLGDVALFTGTVQYDSKPGIIETTNDDGSRSILVLNVVE